jgi:hypothetical protein
MTFPMNNETNLNCLFLEKSQNKLLMNQDNYINLCQWNESTNDVTVCMISLSNLK